MRKLIVATAVILLVNSMGWTANAATTAPVSAPECSEKLLADSRSRLPRLGPLVWTGLCESLRSVPMLVPSLLVRPIKAEAARSGGLFIPAPEIPYFF